MRWFEPEPPPERSALRRLAFMLLALVIVDLCVPSVLHRLEQRRYENGPAFRFENSDLFGLGPLVAYLREHPRGASRRAVFFGNSMIFGYLLAPADALPAQYERRMPGTRAFNMAINGQEMGTSYLVEKAIIDSVDVFFVQEIGDHAHPMLGSLIPVDARDAARFRLDSPDPLEHRLDEGVRRFWRLYRDKSRLQAAMFGTSTRQYLYLNKRDLAKRLLGPLRGPKRPQAEPPLPPGAEEPVLLPIPAPTSTTLDRSHLSAQDRMVVAIADVARAHRKRVVFLQFEHLGFQPTDDTARFNAAYRPYAERVVIRVPRTFIYDEQHLSPHGSALVAELLARHEAEAEKGVARR
jgi:hypothetical protein